MEYDLAWLHRTSRFYGQCLADVIEKLHSEPGDEFDSPADVLVTTLVR